MQVIIVPFLNHFGSFLSYMRAPVASRAPG
jgi:hypothetical protein